MATKKNICPNDDIFNRYKRDVIQVVHEKKNGGQTRMVNIETIAKQLHVTVESMTTFIQKQINQRIRPGYVITGTVEISTLESALDQFIQSHVLCQQCGLPELGEGVCKACGSKYKNLKK
jgi:translation initiation factor 2 beta subunit (eIF-2beta)/eIF-5